MKSEIWIWKEFYVFNKLKQHKHKDTYVNWENSSKIRNFYIKKELNWL